MPRRGARCTQADIARAVRAAQQVGGGYDVELCPDGTIRIVKAAGASRSEADAPKINTRIKL